MLALFLSASSSFSHSPPTGSISEYQLFLSDIISSHIPIYMNDIIK